MKSVRFIPLAVLSMALGACDQEPLRSKSPAEPPPLTQGVQAFVQVDNDQAQPGDRINVYVRVQMGTESQAKLGSYTGRLRFDPAAVAWVSDQPINDGLRVTNPKGADGGDVRFAGASATGFNDLALYHGVFEVRKAGYMTDLRAEMEELSSAATLGDLKPQLKLMPQIFLRAQAQ